jgi:cytochrome c oxidase accessory protein FixG
MEAPDRVLSTLERDGSRRWIYPRLAKGSLWQRRRIFAYFLIAVFTGIPYMRMNGKPLFLIDLPHRRLFLLGSTFLPTDTVYLALFMVGLILGIFFLTAVVGRAWCGWACPQTVYLEFLYRPIERLFTGVAGVGGRPKRLAAWRVIAKHATFLFVSMYLAHTFLSYFVGVDQLRHWVTTSPALHPVAFLVMLFTTGAMMFNFGWFREQTCIIACPYGRFQSVLLDRDSLIISYDTKRGEPRGKMRSPLPVLEDSSLESRDCVDCMMCVNVCPTGIDIRNGLQAECIACAQCIDACDAVMTKIKRPIGLIRYSSQNAMAGQTPRLLRPRVAIYWAGVFATFALLTVMLWNRSPADVTLLRSLGRPFVMTDSGLVENELRLKLTNRTDESMSLRVSALTPNLQVLTADPTITLAPHESQEAPVRVQASPASFKLGTFDTKLRVTLDGGRTIDRACRLLGPFGDSEGAGNAR